METRIYVVSSTKNLKPPRLVEAISQAQALRHVAQDEYSVQTATTKEVAQLLAARTPLEQAQIPSGGSEAAGVGIDQQAQAAQ